MTLRLYLFFSDWTTTTAVIISKVQSIFSGH